MGPFRVAWSFPYTVDELIYACNKKEARLAALVDLSLTMEQDAENELASYRETLRKAGVRQWEFAQMPTSERHLGNPERDFRLKQKSIQKEIDEIQKWRRQFEHDKVRQADRTFKLSIEDINYFEL